VTSGSLRSVGAAFLDDMVAFGFEFELSGLVFLVSLCFEKEAVASEQNWKLCLDIVHMRCCVCRHAMMPH